MNRYLLISYGLAVLGFVVFSYSYIDINFFYLKALYTGIAVNQRFLVTNIYTIFVIIFFLFYTFLLYQVRVRKVSFVLIKTLILVSSFLIFSYPAILSFDIFNYMSTAKVACFYWENPYIVMPIEFVNDPMLLYTRAANKLALYGPIWITATCIPFLLGYSNFLLSIFLFKALPAICYFGICYLVYRLSNKNLYSLAFFALNPVVLIETFVSGHNDSTMMFLALASFYFLFKKKIWSGILFIILSMLIKFATVFLLPLFIFVALRQSLGRRVEGDSIWFWSGISMFIIFLLSPLREEMYPWYAIWLIPFVSLLNKRKILQTGIMVFSFGLMLTYLPYMATGTYQGLTPLTRTILVLLPPLIFLIIVLFLKFNKHKWPS